MEIGDTSKYQESYYIARMRIGLIGIGQAGGKITDKIVEYSAREETGFVRSCLAVNTARQDLRGLEFVPEEKRVRIGESEVKGSGVGADNDKGKEIMQDNIGSVMSKIDDMPLHELDAFFLVAGLGGGTGSGGMPVLANEIRERYQEPVFGLGVLPSTTEGKIYTLNAAQSLEACVNATDNLILFDNNEWPQKGETLEQWYNTLNDEIAKRFSILFGAGELSEYDDIGESVVDASEVVNTLKSGGISSIGFGSDSLDEAVVNPSFLDRLRGKTGIDNEKATGRIESLVRKSVNTQLTVPIETDSVERALVVLSGPQEFLTRKGMEKGRTYVEDTTGSMEVRGGDYPRPDDSQVSCVVLLSGVYDIPRVEELQELAVETSDTIDTIREEREDEFDNIMQNEHSEQLDSLFSEH